MNEEILEAIKKLEHRIYILEKLLGIYTCDDKDMTNKDKNNEK